jgi:hypothetical protein
VVSLGGDKETIEENRLSDHPLASAEKRTLESNSENEITCAFSE